MSVVVDMTKGMDDREFAKLIGEVPSEDAAPATSGRTRLSSVLADITSTIAKEPPRFEMRYRPGFTITYAGVLTLDRITKLQSLCGLNNSNGGNVAKFHALLLATACTEIRHNGTLVFEDDDATLFTLNSPALCKELGFPQSEKWRAIVAFFGDESDLISHANGVVSEWGGEPIRG